MSRFRIFQTLVLASVAFHFVWLVAPGRTDITSEALEALRWAGYGGKELLQHPIFYWAMGVLKIIAAVGLVLFRTWGRWLLLLLLGLNLAQLPFNGISVGLPHESIIGALTGLVDGAVLALAFVLAPSAASGGKLTSRSSSSPTAAADL